VWSPDGLRGEALHIEAVALATELPLAAPRVGDGVDDGERARRDEHRRQMDRPSPVGHRCGAGSAEHRDRDEATAEDESELPRTPLVQPLLHPDSMARDQAHRLRECLWSQDRLLVRYADVVGTHRWPGSPLLSLSARVGPAPIALWSDVVVSHAVAEVLGIPMGAPEKGGRAYETDGCGVACC
jgi:hypothetical protein